MCTGSHTHEPVDAVVERLNDPTVAAALVTLLDNTELISTLVIGLSALVERGDVIMDSVAGSVQEFKTSAQAPRVAQGLPPISELSSLMGTLTASTPTLAAVLDSKMVQPETIELLSDLSDATTEGVKAAQANRTTVKGIRGLLKASKDPEVQRGMGLMIEIAKALGRRYS